jgi:hypothetical protein
MGFAGGHRRNSRKIFKRCRTAGIDHRCEKPPGYLDRLDSKLSRRSGVHFHHSVPKLSGGAVILSRLVERSSEA